MKTMQAVSGDLDRWLDQVPPEVRSPRLEAVYRLAWATMGARPAGRREPGYRFYHGHRVARLALRLWEEEGRTQAEAREPLGVPREEAIWVGALLHDVGKEGAGPDRGGDHAERGLLFVRHHLGAWYPEPALQLIGQIVYRHNKRGDPSDPPEVVVVQDADLLDHFGLMGLWLDAYWMAAEGRTLYDLLRYRRSEEARSWREYAQQHVRLAAARRELALRLAREEEALRALLREGEGLFHAAREGVPRRPGAKGR